jgi:hypothetical protein
MLSVGMNAEPEVEVRPNGGLVLRFILAPFLVGALYLISSGPLLAYYYNGKTGNLEPLYGPIARACEKCPPFEALMDWYVNLFVFPPRHPF